MPTGFDTTVNCGGFARAIKAQGYDFVARYYGHNSEQHPEKCLVHEEAQQLTAAGLAIVVVWETAPKVTEFFSRARGVDEGTSAYHMALLLGQPAGSAIYFAVDYDAPQPAIAGAIADYFRGVTDGFATIAGSSPPAYRIGVYGSGATCSWFLGQRLVTHAWLAQSTKWAGYQSFTNWNIKQGSTTKLLGIDVDPDDASADSGSFTVPPLVA